MTDELYYGGSGRIITVTDLDSALQRSARSSSRARACSTRMSGTATATCSIPSATRSRTTSASRRSSSAAGSPQGDTPQSGPTGEPLEVDWDAVYNMRPNPRSADYPPGSEIRERMEAFNHAYSGVLHVLDETFNGSPSLLAVATGLMYGLKAEAID